jgi:hypothetical protein
MAEILRDEPTLVGIAVQDRILGTACTSLRASLNATPLSSQDLARLSTRLANLLTTADRTARNALVTERCEELAVFQGSNRQVAEFLQQGPAGLGLWLAVEATRLAGILQRDAAFFLQCLDRIEDALAHPSRREVLAELGDVASDVEGNQHMVAVDKQRVNIISCMTLPPIIRVMRRHIWTETLGEATLTAMLVERYRLEQGRLPPDLQALVPQYLQKIPEDPYTGQPLRFRLLPAGYAVSSPGATEPPDARKDAPKQSQDGGSPEIIFQVER